MMQQRVSWGCSLLEPDTLDDVSRPTVIVLAAEKDCFRLIEDFHYTYTADTVSLEICIGAPFDYDGASVPRIAWPLLGKHEAPLSTLLHDAFYRGGGSPSTGYVLRKAALPHGPTNAITRGECDALFLLTLMKEDRIPAWRALLAFAAVRLFGRSSWRAAR